MYLRKILIYTDKYNIVKVVVNAFFNGGLSYESIYKN